MIGPVLAALLAVAAPATPVVTAPEATPAAAAAPAVAVSAPVECPPKKLYPPRFPPDMMRSGKSGTAKVRARVDDCGRVLAVEIAGSSNHPQLDAAALEAVSGFVLGSDAAARAVDGAVVVPIEFGEVETVSLSRIDWPKSHRRPIYLEDDAPIGFTTIEAFGENVTLRTRPALQAPYGMARLRNGNVVMTTIQRERDDASTWWLHYIVQGPLPVGGPPGPIPSRTVALVRYRVGEREGEPAVRVAILCERPEQECAELRSFIMKGLPFAKAR